MNSYSLTVVNGYGTISHCGSKFRAISNFSKFGHDNGHEKSGLSRCLTVANPVDRDKFELFLKNTTAGNSLSLTNTSLDQSFIDIPRSTGFSRSERELRPTSIVFCNSKSSGNSEPINSLARWILLLTSSRKITSWRFFNLKLTMGGLKSYVKYLV